MAVLSTEYHVKMAKLAIESFSNNTPKYVFISRPNPWVNVNRSYDDTIVPLANLSVFQTEGTIYTDLVFGKLITPKDVINMVPRYNWVAGTVYAKYWHTDEYLYSKNFYVVTDDLHVFKCIDNNYESLSFVKPTITSQEGNFFTADGYVWKYMYTIPSDINSKFSTVDYMPVVSNSSIAANAVQGTVDIINLTSYGNNYTAFYSGYLRASINSYVVAIDSNASPYSNFYVGSSMYLVAGYGAGQIRKIVQYDGLNKFVRLDSPFNNYEVFSLVDISGSFNVGDTLVQNLDSLAIYYNTGTFQTGDTIVQSDGGASGQIVSANSTYLQVVRNTPTLFNLTTPVYDTSQAGMLKSGYVSCQPFISLSLLSNTNPFIIGDIIYQNSGFNNVAMGTVFSVQTNTAVVVNVDSNLDVNSSANFISISNNPFSNGISVIYTNSNTALFGLSNNSSYYVVYANSSGIALSNTHGGANLYLSSSLSESFNANTGINVNNFISIANNVFVNAESLKYTASVGNTIPTGLVNGYMYYAVYSNSQGLCLSQTLNGPNVNILASNVSENGHMLTFSLPLGNEGNLTHIPTELLLIYANGSFTNSYQIRGVVSGANAYVGSSNNSSIGLSYAVSTNTAQTAFLTDYQVNDYIRIGDNASTNIRRITSINSFSISMSSAITQTVISNTHYSMPSAAEVASYTLLSSSGTISNTNLNSIQIKYSNNSLSYQLFIPGERINMIDANNIFQGTYGTVAYSNTSTIILSDIIGTGFLQGFYVGGVSSLINAYIQNIDSYPNITVSNPVGDFVLGQQVYSKSSANLSIINGQANVISWFTIPGQLTEYIISPTVTIEGDGEGALAYSVVNTSLTSNFPLANVIVINNGTGFTYANVIISSNLIYGSGATALASVSPRLGHGADPYNELGASYVSISTNISNSTIEDYYFPSFGSYRIIGIIDNPLFSDLDVNVTDFDRVQLSIEYASNAYSIGEIAYQPNTLAAGVVVYSNASYLELKNVHGTFSANGLYPNNLSSNDNIVGMFSGSVANVALAQISHFNVISEHEMVYEINSGANAALVNVIGTTNSANLRLSNVSGRFSANDTIYDPVNNAYATVSSLSIQNNTIDATEVFGYRFNQTLRFPLTSNTKTFQIFEYVTQDMSKAEGQIIGGAVDISNYSNVAIGNDVDMTFSNVTGSMFIGSVVTDTNTNATAVVVEANSSYLRLSSVLGTFSSGHTINNNIGSTATVGTVYPVLILNDVSGEFGTGALSGNVVGSNTGSVGRCDIPNVIQYPDLVRDSGSVLYLENLAPFSLTNNSKEKISLLLQY